MPDGHWEELRKARPDLSLAERRLNRVRDREEVSVVQCGTSDMARTDGNGRSDLSCMP
ncbi:MAG: hypothetical protein LBT40_12315 [Deltaproteobacteria bacterium]|jgi:hypothetical protein|nr:hypothetical protein [Deltaproteobacteria bacterium]